MACIQGAHLGRIGGNRNDARHQQHDQASPLKENRAQIAKGVERAKDVDENLVNHHESESHAERVADPEDVERGGIIVPEGRKQGGEGDHLNQHIAEEDI